VKLFKAKVKVEGSLVSATYEQLFVNESDSPIELLYSVPLTETVTVTGLIIQLADKEIKCEI
jgi:Vault protein inter-alpha-trypsin domain